MFKIYYSVHSCANLNFVQNYDHFPIHLMFFSGTHNSVRGCIVKAASHAVAETGCYECDEKSDTNSCKTRTINCYCDSDNCNHSNTILAVPLVLQICGVIIKLALF